jgi:hypothetical protein
MPDNYESQTDIEAVVSGFESCRLSKEDFSHYSHLSVAVWYLFQSSFDEAANSMRAGLLRFIDHHGIRRQKYHETLTIFWLKVVRARMDELKQLNLVELTNAIIRDLGNTRLVFEYYSHEHLMSDEARKRWVEPDLKELK